MQVFQIGLALQLHSSTKGRHWAAAKAFCPPGKVIAKLQHLLQLCHLHLICGCCPATDKTVIGLAASRDERPGDDVVITRLSTSPLSCYFQPARHAVQCKHKPSPASLLLIVVAIKSYITEYCLLAGKAAFYLDFCPTACKCKNNHPWTTQQTETSMLTFSYHCPTTAKLVAKDGKHHETFHQHTFKSYIKHTSL